MGSRVKNKYMMYIIRWNKIGAPLKKVLIVFFAITFISQILFFLDIRSIPKSIAVNLEGEAIAENLVTSTKGEIKFVIDNVNSLSNIIIYVNGERIENLDRKSISVKVSNKDIIEVSGVNCQDRFNVTIQSVSDNISYPIPSLSFPVNKNKILIGKVKMK